MPAHLDVHVVLDNSSTHKTPSIQRWLVRHPRFTLHFTPTYSSWLNLVERWFAELTTKWIKRSAHRSVRDLVASIRTWITNWNDDPKPFVWHKTADEILDSLASLLPADQRLRSLGACKDPDPAPSASARGMTGSALAVRRSSSRLLDAAPRRSPKSNRQERGDRTSALPRFR